MGLGDLGAIGVGAGPGALAGLRVGLATEKGLAHALGIPIVGVATSTALLRAAASADAAAAPRLALLLPAGPSDRVLVAAGEPILLPGGTEPELRRGRPGGGRPRGRAPVDAVARGERARAVGTALVRIGAERLAGLGR